MAQPQTPDFQIAILGAGFAGIGMGIQLKKAGILSFTIYEQADEVGGTWRDNSYPGSACDVESDVYSFSFEPNPNWSRKFSPWHEIRDYLINCTDKHQLRSHIRFGTEINAASFDEEAGLWHLQTSHGDTVTARVVISGLGGLLDPSLPDINGLQNFKGEMFHTARWNHDYDLTDKRVAVIGTGASAVQLIPEVAKLASKVNVFQRTAGWIMPKNERTVKESTKRLYRRYPLLQRVVRTIKYWLNEMRGPFVILDSPRLSSVIEYYCARHLNTVVENPETREKLRSNFQFGCKRVLLTDDYYRAFNRNNVELITAPIKTITHNAIVTEDEQEYPVDALVLATGFQPSLATAPFNISGLGGRSLNEAWKDGAAAYKGLSVAGFPNWFIMMGPNTGPGHTSVLVYTEAQIRHALQAIKKMIAEDIKYITVKQSVQDAYYKSIQQRMKYTVWTSGSCNSWYLSDDGTNHSLYPGLAAEYVVRTRNFKPADYDMVMT